MAVYDGFFDAMQDETTGKYDREYETGAFTGYFANIIGSGVCVHGNPDSFKVRLEEGKAVVSPGYLFIQGYWCKNDADYTIELPGTGNYAIVAHLNLGARMIEMEARSVAQAYPDSLVLAIVSPASAEDTRYNTDLCGVIESAGDMSSKVEWAVNYIDNEIESKLAQVEQDINAQAAKLDKKIAEVQAVADSIVPPPIGSIKFSASRDVGEEWLRCDGSFVTEAEYPELVTALGKLIPSGDKFKLISDGEVGAQISNGVVYGGRLWVYSYSAKKLYGIDLDGAQTVKEIELTSEDAHFNDFIAPSTAKPLVLSIVPRKVGEGAEIFLAQIIKQGSESAGKPFANFGNYFLIYGAAFSADASSIALDVPFDTIPAYAESSSSLTTVFDPALAVPMVTSNVVDGVEVYSCISGYALQYNASMNPATYYYPLCLDWDDNGKTATASPIYAMLYDSSKDANVIKKQRIAFSHKNKGEAVSVNVTSSYTNTSIYAKYDVKSEKNGIFDFSSGSFYYGDSTKTKLPSGRTSECPINIVGYGFVLTSFDKKDIPYTSINSKAIGKAKITNLPSAARVFVDAAAYLWGKDIYLIFVGTGIIFSRDLEKFGYLDTTSVLGTITQFGYLDYDTDEGTLYILGQDTANKVKAAKIVLNTLYDYANDGAWLPMIASDGVPAYIKAKQESAVPVGDVLKVTTYYSANCVIEFNGEILAAGTREFSFPGGTGTATIVMRSVASLTYNTTLSVNNTVMATLPKGTASGEQVEVKLNVASYMGSGMNLSVRSTTV